MSFIDNIRKTTTKLGNIAKETYGPLAPLLALPEAGILRYPLDVGSTQKYPHTVEFQTWIPRNVPITDMGVIQAGQDTAGSLVDKIKQGGQHYYDEFVKGQPGKPYQAPPKVTEPMPKVDRNQKYNDRMLDFRRRSDISDLITMYLPQGTWNDRHNNLYSQKSMTEALGAIGAVLEVGGSVVKAWDTEKGSLDQAWDMLNGPAGMEMAAKLAGKFGIDAKDAGLNSIGYALNPQFEMLYTGTDLREFQFDFTMTPRSADEAEMIRRIVKKFKYHASPAYVKGQGRYIVPPSYFDITFNFNGRESEWLPTLSTCVLKSIDIDYTGGLEQWAAHADGSPVQVRMVLVFQELEMMHKRLRKLGY